MSYQTIIVEKRDGWAKLTLNRPQVLNALNSQVQHELDMALDEIERDEEIRVLVVAGAGRSFCAGADLKEVLTRLGDVEKLHSFSRGYIRLCTKIENMSKPTIAMVHGHVLAGGLELALGCDIIIAAEDAVVGDQHANFGLVPGGGNTQRIPRVMGVKRGLAHILTGEWLSGKEAERLGLVSKAVPADKLEEATMGVVNNLLLKSQIASRTIKNLVYRGMQGDINTGLKLELFGVTQHFFSEDCREGLDAFVGKRQPKFKGN